MREDLLETPQGDQDAASAAEDAFLAALEGEDAEEPSAPEEAAQAPEGDVVPEVAPQADAEPDSGPVGAEGDEQDQPADPSEGELETADSEEYERALVALRYEGATDEAIAALPREAIIAWGSKARQKQITQKAKLQELADERKALEAKLETTGQGDLQTEPTSTPDLDALEPVFAELGEAASKPLKSYLEAQAAREAQLQQQTQEALHAVQAQHAELQMQRLRDGFRERFPGLNNDESFAVVSQKMETLAALAANGQYPVESPEAAMLDAIRMAGLQEQQPVVQERSSDDAQRIAAAKVAGTPSAATRRTDGALGASSNVDPQSAALDWLEKHPGDVAGARKVFGQSAT